MQIHHFGQKEPDSLINEYVVYLNNGMEIQVKEYEEKEENSKRYEAEFEYAGAQYEIKGVVEKAEFEKILKNLYFLNKTRKFFPVWLFT